MLQGTGFQAISSYLKITLIPSVASIRTANIFDSEVTDLGGYPAVTITLKGLDSSFLDNTRNKHVFDVSIKIFIDRNKQNFGVSTSEDILRQMAGELISAIDADYNLGGNCIYCEPFIGSPAYVDRENQNIRFIEVSLKCVDANKWR